MNIKCFGWLIAYAYASLYYMLSRSPEIAASKASKLGYSLRVLSIKF